MKSTDSQFRLRLPVDLKARLEEAAKAEGRSINAQVLVYLEESLNRAGPVELAAQLEDVQQELSSLRENFVAVLRALRDNRMDDFVTILDAMGE